jgi:hypothetical protein
LESPTCCRTVRAAPRSFTAHGDDLLGLTPMANALRADAPASVCRIVLFFGHPNHWEHWGHLPYSVQTGRPSVDALRGKPIFEWLTTSRNSPPPSTRA